MTLPNLLAERIKNMGLEISGTEGEQCFQGVHKKCEIKAIDDGKFKILIQFRSTSHTLTHEGNEYDASRVAVGFMEKLIELYTSTGLELGDSPAVVSKKFAGLVDL